MHFKPLAHLARISFAKGVVHAYTPGAVVAGQQGLGTLHSYPASKLAKATQLQNAFSSSSGSGAGAGAKAGHTSTNASGTDSSLVSYFAAWSHAEQTGDDTEFKKHQNARRIVWKQSDKNPASKNAPRLDIKPADILRQSTRLSASRTHSESAVQDIGRSEEEQLIEAEALARIDEAISQEIKSVNEAVSVDATAVEVEAVQSDVESVQTAASPKSTETSATTVSSPVSDESSLRSEEIVSLGDQAQYADIPFRFQSMVKDGLVPNVHAYNCIIQSAISLAHGYQPFPRAVEVFNDMTNKGVQPNEETYRILISFLTSQSLLASKAQKEIDQHNLRFGYGQGSFMFTSMEHKMELFADDVSIQIATKLYNIARRTIPEFKLNDGQYTGLLAAYEKSGSSASLIATVTDMQSQNVAISADAYVSAIKACAETEDVSTAKWLYSQYRQLAIDRNTSDLFDSKVYVALIKAYFTTGASEDGLHFFEKVLQSFKGAQNEGLLSQHLTDTFVVDGLVDLHTATGDLHSALESVAAYGISEKARAVAINKILSSAADRNEREVIDAAFKEIDPSVVSGDSFMAVAAMHFRHGEVTEARAVWARCHHAPSASFATMYALSVIGTGKIEQGLNDVVGLFRQLRSSAHDQSLPVNASEIDESILLLGQALSHENVIYSSQAAVTLFRLMIENGGLVPFIAQAAIARVGPECVHQLSEQDIALALHVQAYMLPTTAPLNNDVAQSARFSHLLETVLDRQIGMDPSTVHAVDTAIPKLNGARPDLERRWNAWRRPAQTEASPVLVSPSMPHSPMAEQALYDPYSHTTDHRASRAISELLESSSGRLENHISEAMSRLKNVRRMGRHLQYSAYAKLMTAAGKARQSRLLHELLAMAQTDVPLNRQIAAVRNGWVTIYDSMISACLSVGERQLASKFHEEILSMGAAPSANTFGIYITTLEGTFDEATEAVKIFQRAMSEGVQPTVFLFNAVIGKLGKARRIDDCLQYFGQMQALGIRPSSVTYGTLVNALCRTSEESFAVEMFDEMEAAPNYRPRPAPYNSIIQYFLNTKRDRAKVLQYYGRMRSHNIKPTSHTYKLLIESYATLEPVNLTAAEAVLQDMKANGVAPEAVHYGSLIHAKGCVLSDLEGARAIFNSVLTDPAIKPTDNLYQNFLEAMVANHEVANTEAILNDMSSRNIAMTPYIANTLIHGWSGAGEIQKAKAVYDSLGVDKREPSTYEHMTRAFIAAGDHDGANVVVREMLQKGYPAAVADKVLGLVGNPTS